MLWRMESESVSESGLAKGCFGAKAFYWGNAMLGMGRHAGVGYKAGAINQFKIAAGDIAAGRSVARTVGNALCRPRL
ncbi:hypothetical protein D3C80_743070 [compost metagenome]